ncbi:MAG: hypothetical protein IKI20_04470 [Lachnospiraceae bacterium]|nr:hypothetical protein [Lachnospiraceae bacterium]
MDEESRKKKGITAVVLLSILAAMLGVFFVFKLVSIEKDAHADGDKYVVVKDGSRYFLSDNGLYSSEYIVAGEAKGSILYESSDPDRTNSKSSWAKKGFLSFTVDGAADGDLLILELTVKSTNPEMVSMYVEYDEQKEEYMLQEGKKRYYIPFTGKKGERNVLLSFDITGGNEHPVEFSDIRVADYGKEMPLAYLKTGIYDTEEFEQIHVDYSEEAPSAVSMVAYDKYIYAIQGNCLIVYRTASLTELNRMYGIGDADNLVMCEDGDCIYATSKEGLVTRIDISNPEEPAIKSSYITIAACYDADLYGNYAFLSCGEYGIEIVDISSDVPKYVTVMKPATDAKGYASCYVANGALYAYNKGEKTVDVYDITDLNSIRYLTSIETKGAVGNVLMKSDILYIASAGEVCGMELYDVANPEFPLLISMEIADGRIDVANETASVDLWIDGNHAYLSGGEAGLYLYDISNPAKPVRETVAYITTLVGQPKFKNRNPEDTILPYNFMLETHGTITQCVINASGVFCLTSDMGIYQIPSSLRAEGTPDKGEAQISAKIEKEEPEIPEGYETQFYTPEGCIYALSAIDDRQFAAACGTEGIKVLDKQMRTICSLNTRESVKDVKVMNGLIYSAEGNGGLAIYKYENGILTETGRADTSRIGKTADCVEVLPDGNLALVQSGTDDYQLIDCTDPENPAIIKHPTLDKTGTMLQHGICAGIVSGKYVGIAGEERILWIYENGYTAEEGGEIKAGYLKDKTGISLEEGDGFAALSNGFIVIKEDGYSLYDIGTGEVKAKGNNLDGWLCGKCVSDGDMLYVSNAKEGKFSIVDFSDPQSPKLLLKLDTDYITDLPCVVDGEIYVPLRHDGVMKLIKE